MKVMNFGSLNLDRKYGVEKFVAPGETKSADSYLENSGGKGLNQSIACARAGACVWHVGAGGKDGSELLLCLKEEGVETKYIKEVGKEQMEEACQTLEQGDIALFQNEISNVAFGIAKAKETGARVAFNPSPFNEKIAEVDLRNVDYLIVNEVEGMEIAAHSAPLAEEILKTVHKKYPQLKVLLTLGSKGAYFMDGEKRYFQEAFSVKAVDTTGAGDTFCGYFLAGVLRGYGPERILREAAAASALAVQREGAACSIPRREEVEEFLKKNV